jgi:DNA-binding NarL/FixJ family response regulator
MIRVDITDSSPIFTEGLRRALTSGGFKVVAARTTAADSVSWLVDIFLVDPEAVEGLTLAEFVNLTERAAPVLVLGKPTDADTQMQYVEAGASGFVDRRTDVENLFAAIRAVAHGGTHWTDDRPGESAPGLAAKDVVLSPRERQVLRQIASGLTHSQVARRLGISPHTVDTYVKRIRSKLDIGNKAELTRAALLGGFGPGLAS